MDLNKLKVVSLNDEELLSINGGRKLPSWSKIKEGFDNLIVAVGIADIVNRFVDGWNSHQC